MTVFSFTFYFFRITQYTPYQCEIAQGRLQNLLNFQTMIIELTGLDVANASLLDEGTAAAEAMTLFYRFLMNFFQNGSNRLLIFLFLQNQLYYFRKNNRQNIFVSEDLHPQTISVIKTRAYSLGLNVVVGDAKKEDFTNKNYSGILIQYPDTNGEIYDYSDLVARAHQNGVNFLFLVCRIFCKS